MQMHHIVQKMKQQLFHIVHTNSALRIIRPIVIALCVLWVCLFKAVAAQPQDFSPLGSVSNPPGFSSYTNKNVPVGARKLRVVDINNDGRAEFVIGTEFYLFVYSQNSSGELNKPQVYRTGLIQAMDIGDLNDDGLMDIVVAVDPSGVSNTSVDSIRVFYQTPNGRFVHGQHYFAGHGITSLAVSDKGVIWNSSLIMSNLSRVTSN